MGFDGTFQLQKLGEKIAFEFARGILFWYSKNENFLVFLLNTGLCFQKYANHNKKVERGKEKVAAEMKGWDQPVPMPFSFP